MMDRMKVRYSDVQLPVPVEVHGLLQEVQQSVQELEVKVRIFGWKGGPWRDLWRTLFCLRWRRRWTGVVPPTGWTPSCLRSRLV